MGLKRFERLIILKEIKKDIKHFKILYGISYDLRDFKNVREFKRIYFISKNNEEFNEISCNFIGLST